MKLGHHDCSSSRRGGTPAGVRELDRQLDHMTPSVHILAFSTLNYDAMLKFFRDFGFSVVEDPHDQLTPFFEHGRAARISRRDFEFQLEESDAKSAKACFNLFITDFSDSELEKVKALGYKHEHAEGPYGGIRAFRSPDGGVFVV